MRDTRLPKPGSFDHTRVCTRVPPGSIPYSAIWGTRVQTWLVWSNSGIYSGTHIEEISYLAIWGTRVLNLVGFVILGYVPGYPQSNGDTMNTMTTPYPPTWDTQVPNLVGLAIIGCVLVYPQSNYPTQRSGVPRYQNRFVLVIVGYVPGYPQTKYPTQRHVWLVPLYDLIEIEID